MKEKIMELMMANQIDIANLKSLLPQTNTVDIAEVFSELTKEKGVMFFRLLPKTMAADVFSCLDPVEQYHIATELTDDEMSVIINDLFADDATDFIEKMPPKVVKRIMQIVSPEKQAVIKGLLRHPRGSAGSIMTTEYVNLYEDNSVSEAFNDIRATGVNKETIYTCYVTSRDHLLVGTVSAKTLLLSQPDERIGAIMERGPVFAFTDDDQETVAGIFKKYALLAMPIVDSQQRLVGIITIDDIVKVIEEEATEDIEKMGAIAPSDEPYFRTSVFRLAKNRIIWLLVLMLSATITGSIITGFEEAIATLPLLVAFIPMLMDTGGNAGCQSSTLIIRGMALGEINPKDVFSVLWRELRIAILCGIILCLINFVRIYLMNGRDVILATVVTISLFGTVLMAKTIGCILPLLAKKVKIDPAVMSSPLITTIVDAASLIIYFSIARVFFSI